jgi:hypothetical protein
MKHLESRQFYNNVSAETGAAELLRILQPDVYGSGCFKLVPSSAKCINVVGKYVQK